MYTIHPTFSRTRSMFIWTLILTFLGTWLGITQEQTNQEEMPPLENIPGLIGTIQGQITKKGKNFLVLKIDGFTPGRGNTYTETTNLIGKCILLKLTMNPTWKEKAIREFGPIKEGDYVNARIEYSQRLQSNTLIGVNIAPQSPTNSIPQPTPKKTPNN